ncbi:hypothetical protein L7F22_026886, partial [Adiantum nelumboides]|nr:hypothetical protein [Adiantum nelumboides]
GPKSREKLYTACSRRREREERETETHSLSLSLSLSLSFSLFDWPAVLGVPRAPTIGIELPESRSGEKLQQELQLESRQKGARASAPGSAWPLGGLAMGRGNVEGVDNLAKS